MITCLFCSLIILPNIATFVKQKNPAWIKARIAYDNLTLNIFGENALFETFINISTNFIEIGT